MVLEEYTFLALWFFLFFIMRDNSFNERTFVVHSTSGQHQASSSHGATHTSNNDQADSAASGVDEIARIFNTAVVATRVEASRDFSAELYTLIESPAFRAILSSIRQLARSQGVSEREAAEAMIQTFRKVDRVWSDYIFQEGIDRLKNQIGGL